LEDIPALSQFFVQKYGSAREKPVIGISPASMALFTRYSWPGNVRELEHMIERAVVLTPHPIIMPEDLPEALRSAVSTHSGLQSQGWMTLESLEREYILRALEAHQHDLAQTAETLGIHRKTLLRKLRQFGAT
ncbi:MAG: helix-turn-helix domain-containing protein, partial [Nitrospirota bacterium]